MIGIDVYQRYNTVLDWDQVRRDGVGVVWVKLCDGGSRAAVPGDQYVRGARAAGLPVGGYHFAEATPQPEVQAETFAAELVRLDAMDAAPMLDLEGNVPNPQEFRVRFWEHFRQRVNLPIVLTYASAAWWGSSLAASPQVSGEKLWVASYGANDGVEHPTGPANWDVHQYTSHGVLAGISGPVDLDDIRTNVLEPKPTESEDEMLYFEMAAGQGVRYSIPVPRSRRCEITITCDGEVEFTAFGWVSPDGGNGYSDGPRKVHDKGAYVLTPPVGTSKIDFQYSATGPVRAVLDTVS